RRQRDRDRLEVTELTHEDDVRVLTQRMLERGVERVRVRTDLTLVDNRTTVLVEELDRVLDRHDVLRASPVRAVDDRRERRRLARARRARDENEPARQTGELPHTRRDTELL